MEYSIVLPVFNEEENIEELLSRTVETMGRVGGEFEIVMVDDGSTDRSAQIMASLSRKEPRLRVVALDGNHGQSAAIDAGFRAARGRVIITLDADLQNDPRDIPILLDAMKDNHMATGVRRRRRDPTLKRISTRVANWVRNRMSGEEVSDSACGFRAFRRECLSEIKLFDGMHRFLPTLFKMEGFKVVEVDVPHHPRAKGSSKYSVRNRIFRAFIDLLAVCWMKRRHLDYTIKKGPDDS